VKQFRILGTRSKKKELGKFEVLRKNNQYINEKDGMGELGTKK